MSNTELFLTIFGATALAFAALVWLGWKYGADPALVEILSPVNPRKEKRMSLVVYEDLPPGAAVLAQLDAEVYDVYLQVWKLARDPSKSVRTRVLARRVLDKMTVVLEASLPGMPASCGASYYTPASAEERRAA